VPRAAGDYLHQYGENENRPRPRPGYDSRDAHQMASAYLDSRQKAAFDPSIPRAHAAPSHHAEESMSHRERVFSRFGSATPHGPPPQPGPNYPTIPRTMTRFPSLQALRNDDPGVCYRPVPAEDRQARNTRNNYGSASSHRDQHPYGTASPARFAGPPHGYQEYQPSSNQAPPAAQYHHHARRYEADYDTISMLSAMRLSERDIMNDVSAWQAEADEQGRYVRQGQEHHTTRRQHW